MSPPNKPLHIVTPDLEPLLKPIGDLKPDPANARKHAAANVDSLVAMLRRFGQQKPIVIDAQQVIVAGNGVYLAAIKAGWTHIAAIQTELVGADRTAFAIADNRAGELSEWDADTLPQLLASLQADDADLFEATGFTASDLTGLLGDDEPSAPPEPTIPEIYQVVIDCDDEQHQRRVFESLKQEGHACKLLTL